MDLNTFVPLLVGTKPPLVHPSKQHHKVNPQRSRSRNFVNGLDKILGYHLHQADLFLRQNAIQIDVRIKD